MDPLKLLMFGFILIAVASCNRPKISVSSTSNFIEGLAEADGYIVPKDSILLPVVTLLNNPVVIKAGKPKIVQIISDKFTVKNLKGIPAGEPLICIPGQRGYDLPKTITATNKTFIAGLPEVVPAKPPSAKDENPKNISTFGLLQGLKNLNVHVIKQDKYGNLWIATGFGGVCRYDGKSFTHFTEKEGLLSNNTGGIYIDKEENFWFGTYNGVSKFDGKSFTNYTKNDGLADNIAYAITQDQNGNIWIGTYNGLSRLDTKNSTFTNFTIKNGLAENSISSLLRDKNGNIWIGTFTGGISVLSITEIKGQPTYTFKNYTEKEGIANNRITAFYEDVPGNIWIGTNGGVTKFSITGTITKPTAVITNYTKEKGLSHNEVNCITGDEKGNIWIGTEEGISVLETTDKNPFGSFSYIKEKDGLPNNSILSLFNDKYNNIWIGADRGGISKYKGNSFRFYKTTDGLSNNIVSAIIEDRNGYMWMGTYGNGITRYKPSKEGSPAVFFHYSVNEGLSDNFIYALHEDKNGNIWIGNRYAGLSKFEPAPDGKTGTFKHYSKANGLPANFVASITEDKHGNIWFGAMESSISHTGGVCKLDGLSLTFFGEKQGLIDGNIWTVEEDMNGNFWFGSWGEGLTKYEPAKDGEKGMFTHYTNTRKNGILENKVRPILADSKGNIWVGGLGGGGMTKFQTAKGKRDLVKHYTRDEGLSNNDVLSILEDKKGDLWFGNYYGLSQLPNNKTKKNTQGSPFINYTPEHGFQGIGSLTNSICQSSDGLIWIGCADRLTVFDPENLKPDTTLPNVQLTAISLFNEKISWVNDSALILNNGVTVAGFTFDKLSKWYNIPENLSLAYNNNFISFHFVGININTPQNIKYQYILEGLEKNWSTTTSLSEASYGNLSPGSYIFKVKSKNGDGNWSEPVAYPFRIRPPWWRTWWAWLIYSIIIIGLVYAFIRFRINQERQKVKILEAIRTKISSDLHDDVGSILSGLAMQSQVMAYSAKEDQKEGLNEISNMSREAMEVMRDTVWAMDSRKDKFENLIDRMRAFAEKNLNRKNITHEFAIEDIDGKKFINPEKRQTIYLIFKEAITNIIKHCDGSHVIIKFAYSKNSLYLLVHDNGSEKAACNSDGLGLSNMKMRAEKIGGTLNTKFSNGFMVELKV